MTECVVGFWTHPTYTLRDMASDIRVFKWTAARHMKK